jgi:hypothetical protein
MADEGPSRRGLRKDLFMLHAMVAVMGLVLLLMLATLSQLTTSMELTYFLGAILAAVGLAIVAASVYSVSMPYLAVGAALQFAGGALSSIGIMTFEDILSLLIVMAMPPLAFGQYQIGACIITIKGFVEAEGVDYGPALADLRDHILESMRSLAMLCAAGFGVSVLILIFIAFFSDVLALNSLAVMGVLVVAVVAGAALMLMLKGGKVVLEEVGEATEPKKEADEGPAGAPR